MIKFSIITVTFRAGNNLSKTACSVEEQTYPGVEHIIVDGASPDGTLSQITDYEDRNRRNGYPHEIVWISEPDKGIYDAMNKGLKMATGDYVCFLNAGDCFPSPNTLYEISDKIGSGDLPAVLYGNTAIVDSVGNYIGPRHLSAPDKLTWKSFRHGMLVCHQAFYARTDIAKANPYNLKYRFSADVDWCIRVMKMAERKNLSFLNLNAVVVNYLNEGQTTQNHKKSLKERYRIMCVHYGWLSTTAMHCWFLLRALKRYLFKKILH